MNAELEASLWQRRPDAQTGWDCVLRYLVERLQLLLEQPVHLERVHLSEPDAFSCRIRSGTPLGGALQIEWRGVLGMQPIEGESHTTATLFLFSRGQRLVLEGGNSIAEFEYARNQSGVGEWKALGWLDDEFGEWEGLSLNGSNP